MSVALDIQHAKRMRRIVMCGLSDSTIFFHVFIQTTQFLGRGELLNIECLMFVGPCMIVISEE